MNVHRSFCRILLLSLLPSRYDGTGVFAFEVGIPRRTPTSSIVASSWTKYGTPSLLRPTSSALYNSESEDDSTSSSKEESLNPVTKASWYAVEWFGKAAAALRDVSSTEDSSSTTKSTWDMTQPPNSVEETLARIQLDNDRSYFLSGQVDKEIYATNCVFRDPFVSFEGRDRFVTNLANLGSFITNYDARVLEYNQPDDTTIQTKIMVKLELNLPWKPILAWPWGVTYTIDSGTNLIVDHEESWDIAPWEGVKQIFRQPKSKIG